MLQMSIIFFRELLEITLILGIVAAATQGVYKRNIYLIIGIGSGVVISFAGAFLISKLASLVSGSTQDIINAAILLISVIMIGITVIWMRKNVSTFKQNLKDTSLAINHGSLQGYAISALVAIAIIREGAEILLFSYGLITAHNYSLSQIIGGTLIGSITGLLAGLLIYFGLIKIGQKYIFVITSWLLIFLAASIASQIPIFLVSAGIIHEVGGPVWNSSEILSEHSIVGSILHIIIGYSEKPTVLQLIFYFTTFGLISISYLNEND
jgi:high-affinity iron transporter